MPKLVNHVIITLSADWIAASCSTEKENIRQEQPHSPLKKRKKAKGICYLLISPSMKIIWYDTNLCQELSSNYPKFKKALMKHISYDPT